MMSAIDHGREFELKFRAATQDLSALGNTRIAGACSGEPSKQELVSTYFDTRKHKLKRSGVTLRVRRVGANYIQTVKAAATDSFARGEWECKLEKPAPDLDMANDTPLARLNSKKLRTEFESHLSDFGAPHHPTYPDWTQQD